MAQTLKKRTARITAMVIATMTSTTAPGFADGIQNGLLVLHDRDSEATISEFLTDSNANCKLWRQGKLVGAQGNFETAPAEIFSVFTCQAPIIDNADTRAAFREILSVATVGQAIEGTFAPKPSEDSEDPTALAKRAYILKLSFFNDVDQGKRNNELDAINELAAERENAWQTEASMAINASIGIKQPDAVDMIYYDTAQAGEDFRSKNGDILNLVGKFNKDYVSAFTYIAGALEVK